MGGAIAAEWLKLRKRPAVWVCFGLAVALLVLLGYLLTYFIFTYTKPPTNARGVTVDYALLKTALYPAHFHQNTMGNGVQLGGVIALIVGVLAQGSEYGWGTVKTAFTQRPHRVAVVGARLLVLAGFTLVLSIVLLALGAVVSWALASVDGKPTGFPDWYTIFKATLALWLIYAFWAVFGFALATLFQQSALAIGLGLAYALVIEALIFGLADQFVGNASKQIHQWFPLDNMNFVVQSFGRATPPEATNAISAPFAGGTHGVIMLLVYCAAFTALTLVLTQRRDVT